MCLLAVCFYRKALDNNDLNQVCLTRGFVKRRVSGGGGGGYSGYSGFPPSSKTNTFKFQFDLDCCQALYHEPLAREIEKALPVLLTLKTLPIFPGRVYNDTFKPASYFTSLSSF